VGLQAPTSSVTTPSSDPVHPPPASRRPPWAESAAAWGAPPELHDVPWVIKFAHRWSGLTRTDLTLGLLAFGVALYGFGLLLAISYGESMGFLRLYIIPVMIAGICFTIGSANYLVNRYRKIIAGWGTKYDDDGKARLHQHWKNACHSLWTLSVAGTSGLIVVAYIGSIRFSNAALLPVIGSADWIVFGPWPLFGYLLLLGFLVGFIAGWGVFEVSEHIRFIRSAFDDTFDLKAELAGYDSARAYGTFLATAALLWTGALTLCAVVLYRNVNLFSLTIFSGASFAGLTLFVAPQVLLHQSIVRAKRAHLAELQRSLPGDWEKTPLGRLDDRTISLLRLARDIDSVSDWPVNLPAALLAIFGAVIPFLFGYLLNIYAATGVSL
jgi:hypothetical protein